MTVSVGSGADQLWRGQKFGGAKAAIFCGGLLLCYLRDDRSDLPWPGHWDFPGGGREGSERPSACLLRELEEEFGLRLPPERLLLGFELGAMRGAGASWFFAAELSPAEVSAIRFGDEGQYWQLMSVPEYLAHPLAIAPLQQRLALVLAQMPSLQTGAG